jgi:hypothetical protein
METRPFKADLGPATATGFLFIADHIEDSFVRGTLNVLGLEDVSFGARVDAPFQVTVLNVTVVIKFDIPTQAFVGSARKADACGSRSQQSAVLALLG